MVTWGKTPTHSNFDLSRIEPFSDQYVRSDLQKGVSIAGVKLQLLEMPSNFFKISESIRKNVRSDLEEDVSKAGAKHIFWNLFS